MPRTPTSTFTQLLNSDPVDDFLLSLCQTRDDAYLMEWIDCNAPTQEWDFATDDKTDLLGDGTSRDNTKKSIDKNTNQFEKSVD